MLAAWFEQTGCAKNVFAKTVGVSPPMINEWLSENEDTRSRPKGNKRKLIERATGGEVPERSWETLGEREAIARVRPIVVPSVRHKPAAGGAR